VAQYVNLDKYSAVNKKWKERKKSETSVLTDLTFILLMGRIG
jgi:hypothetical protein